MLMVLAGVISWMVHDQLGAVIIFAIILANTLTGFVQEYIAERKLYSISNLVQPTAVVKRDGVFREIAMDEVVVGDLVQINPGTIAPADINLTYADNLLINESTMTGEGFAVMKTLKKDRIVRMGTVVVQGMGEGTVSAIGKDAMLGQIVNLAETGRPTHFEREMRKLSELTVGIIIVTAIALFAFTFWLQREHALSTEFLIFLLAICIGILPETLPLIASAALSHGAMTLSKMGVVVRNLSAIQDLGSITVLCSDKTGTLTENAMSVSGQFVCNEEALSDVLSVARGLQSAITDPFQQALALIDHHAMRTVRLLHTLPFDPMKRSASFIVTIDGKQVSVFQGAPELVQEKLGDRHEDAKQWIENAENEGNRVLAFWIEENNAQRVAALFAFQDPIRTTAKRSLDEAKRLGITVKVVSGDSERVTAAVATKLGLLAPMHQPVSGFQWSDMPEMSKNELAATRSVFCRFLPAQKHELIAILQRQGEVVGYMGDGINDAPSLKLADVGISVSNGADIAKSASDIILLKSGLHVVISGIQQGRATFENISKYIRESLTENLGNFLSISILSFFIPYLPMLPLQILFTNLLTDFQHLSIASDTVDRDAVKAPRHFRMLPLLRFMLMLGIISSSADIAYFALFKSGEPSVVQSGWFIFSTVTATVTIFATRSRKFFFQGRRPSFLLFASSFLVIATAFGLVFWPPAGIYLKLTPVPLRTTAIFCGILVLYFLLFDVVKQRIYKTWPETF